MDGGSDLTGQRSFANFFDGREVLADSPLEMPGLSPNICMVYDP